MTGSAAPQKSTILIVDDEPFNVDYLQQLLSDLGFRTREAFGGREALDSVADDAPDLILLDVMMPDIDGITVCRMLKDDPATRLIPIVIMTALDGTEDRIRGIEAGADDFLTKPVDDRELLARINAALRTKHAVDETIGELASAAEQLEGIGPHQEEVAMLAVELRPGTPANGDSPAEARDYLLTRYRDAVIEVLERGGGELVATRGDHLLAVMRSPKGGADSAGAMEAALSIRTTTESLNRNNRVQPWDPAIAICVGEASIAPLRVEQEGGVHWTVSVTGDVCDQTLVMVGQAGPGDILAGAAVIDQLRGRYLSEPVEPADRAIAAVEPRRVLGVAPESGAGVGATSQESVGEPFRMMATILVTDLVGSTEIAVRLGDRVWTDALEGHYQLVRSMFDRFGGEEISTSGDGFLALFDRPAIAIQAGRMICEQSAALDLPVRIGIHTGELERTDEGVQGIAVHLAARVSAEADGGEVLVSSTTKDAVAGSGLRFDDKGERTLKGIDGPRHVYLVLPD